jgi:hypothetical protein
MGGRKEYNVIKYISSVPDKKEIYIFNPIIHTSHRGKWMKPKRQKNEKVKDI